MTNKRLIQNWLAERPHGHFSAKAIIDGLYMQAARTSQPWPNTGSLQEALYKMGIDGEVTRRGRRGHYVFGFQAGASIAPRKVSMRDLPDHVRTLVRDHGIKAVLESITKFLL